jgi:chromosomal replication initiation ATPase DnaA
MTNEQKLKHIMETVAQEWDISVDDIKSKYRYRKFVEARQVYSKLSRDLTNITLKEIAAAVGTRDHTTIIYGVRHIADIMITEFGVKSKYDRVYNWLRKDDRITNEPNLRNMKPPFPGAALIYRPYPKLMLQS